MQEDQIGTEGLGMGRRMTVKRKREAVTRLLRGEDLEFAQSGNNSGYANQMA